MAISQDQDNSNTDKEDRLQTIVKYTDEWYSAFNEHIERARNNLIFLYVSQWDASIKRAREAINKPTMQFNKLVSIIRSVLGGLRDNSPTLTVRGIGEKVSQDTVDIMEGLIRYIQYDSDADIAYQVAGRHGLECGWGAVRVVAEYKDGMSFEQVLKIKALMDFQSAFWDPSATEANKSDGDYCGVTLVMSKDKFKKFNKECPNPESVTGLAGNYYLKWNSRDVVVLAEIYVKDYFDVTLCQMSDGKVLKESEAKEVIEMQDKFLEENPYAFIEGFKPLSIVNKRKSKDYKIKHFKFVQNQILEETDYPGKLLPIVYFEGDSTVIDGEQIPISYIQDAIDPQKLINYIGSEIAYAILRSRKETVYGTAKMFDGHRDEWLNPDQVQGFLEYNYDREAGKPEFIEPPVFSDSFLAAYNSSTQDLMQIIGRFEESRGEESNAISGIAIDARQQAANKPVNLYDNNNQRGIKQIGKVLIDMIPHIYDTERSIMIIGADNKAKPANINKQNGFNMLPDGDVEPNIENDLTKGSYDVEVRVDGSYDAQRAKAMDVLIKMAAINPAIANLIPDLMAKETGLENTQQLVERLKNLVPPQIIAKEEGKEMPPQMNKPDPMIEIQKERNKIDSDKNIIAEKEIEMKRRQQLLDEQKLMNEATMAGIDAKVSMVKAAAEVHKASTSKDIAILNHGNIMTQHHTPKKENKKTKKK